MAEFALFVVLVGVGVYAYKQSHKNKAPKGGSGGRDGRDDGGPVDYEK